MHQEKDWNISSRCISIYRIAIVIFNCDIRNELQKTVNYEKPSIESERIYLYDRTVRFLRVSAFFFSFMLFRHVRKCVFFCISLYYVYQCILTLAWDVESSRKTVREASPASGFATVSPLCSLGSVASINSTVATSSCIKAPKEILIVIWTAISGYCRPTVIGTMMAEKNEEELKWHKIFGIEFMPIIYVSFIIAKTVIIK